MAVAPFDAVAPLATNANPAAVSPYPLANECSITLSTDGDDNKGRGKVDDDDDTSDSASLISTNSPMGRRSTSSWSTPPFPVLAPPGRLPPLMSTHITMPEHERAQQSTSAVVELTEDGDDNASDSTSLLSTSSHSHSCSHTHYSRSISSSERISSSSERPAISEHRATPPAPDPLPIEQGRPAAVATPELAQSRATDERRPDLEEWAAWTVALGGVFFLCSLLTPALGMSYYLFRCLALFFLSTGLVAFSCHPEADGSAIDHWFLANPRIRSAFGSLLILQSLIRMQLAPHANVVDAFLALRVTCYECIGRNVPALQQPRLSALFSYWFSFYHVAEAIYFVFVGTNFAVYDAVNDAPSFEGMYDDGQIAAFRGGLVFVLTAFRFGWLEWQSERFRSTDGASGVSPSQALVYSFYGFMATKGFCDATVGVYSIAVGNVRDGVGVLVAASCQSFPVLAVATVGWARLRELLGQLNRGSHLGDTGASRVRWGTGKIALGGIIFGLLVAYHALLEKTCANTSPNDGAGELTITLGGYRGITFVGASFPAPLYVDAGAELTTNGTAEGTLLWVENLCDEVLDCSSCPLAVDSSFNVSALYGKILLYDIEACEEIYTCGQNRLGRAFGRTGLVGLAVASKRAATLVTPGFYPKLYRRGEHRDARPRNGDAGIPFPHVHIDQHEFSTFMLDTGLVRGGTDIHAVITPTAPNPWRASLCGFGKPLSTLLMLGNVGVAERAVSNWIGHVRMSGLRLDLAQLALVTETLAQLLMAIVHHDPFLSFHWGALPAGATSALLFGAVLLTCSSTLLLAAFWCVTANVARAATRPRCAEAAVTHPNAHRQVSNDRARRPCFRRLRKQASMGDHLCCDRDRSTCFISCDDRGWCYSVKFNSAERHFSENICFSHSFFLTATHGCSCASRTLTRFPITLPRSQRLSSWRSRRCSSSDPQLS